MNKATYTEKSITPVIIPVILLLMTMLLLTSCNPKNESKVTLGYENLLVTDPDSTGGQVKYIQKFKCNQSKGKWIVFNNGCANHCRYLNQKAQHLYPKCTATKLESCQCPKGKCWNLTRCTTLYEYQESLRPLETVTQYY